MINNNNLIFNLTQGDHDDWRNRSYENEERKNRRLKEEVKKAEKMNERLNRENQKLMRQVGEYDKCDKYSKRK